jgi:hypothetical protein
MTLREFFADHVPVSVTICDQNNSMLTTEFSDGSDSPSDPRETMLKHDAGQWLDAVGTVIDEYSVGDTWYWNAQGDVRNAQGTPILYLRAKRAPEPVPKPAPLGNVFVRLARSLACASHYGAIPHDADGIAFLATLATANCAEMIRAIDAAWRNAGCVGPDVAPAIAFLQTIADAK